MLQRIPKETHGVGAEQAVTRKNLWRLHKDLAIVPARAAPLTNSNGAEPHPGKWEKTPKDKVDDTEAVACMICTSSVLCTRRETCALLQSRGR